MKNWKTTVVGALTAIIIAIQGAQSHNLATVGTAVGIALLGFFAKDIESVQK